MDPAHSLLLAPPLHPSPAQLWPLPISHAKLGSPPPTPHPHPQQGKKLPSEAQMLTKNPCLYCQALQKSIIDTRIYLPQTQQGAQQNNCGFKGRHRSLPFCVSRCWRHRSQVLPGVAPGLVGENCCTHLTMQSYQSFDSKRAESEKCRLEVRWLARVQSHDHHGMSKKLKGLGEGGRGQIIIPC